MSDEQKEELTVEQLMQAATRTNAAVQGMTIVGKMLLHLPTPHDKALNCSRLFHSALISMVVQSVMQSDQPDKVMHLTHAMLDEVFKEALLQQMVKPNPNTQVN